MKKTYAADYFNLIRKGLDNMIVTDDTGKGLDIVDAFDIWAERVHRIAEYQNGLMMFCGNGASATMAEHMSHDWFQNAHINTTTVSETSHLTAISNDISYDDVFRYRIERIISSRDLVVGISSSGNSPNIVNAITAANAKDAFTVTVTGKKDDNQARTLGNINFYVPLDCYGEVESAHAVLLHGALDYYLDKYMGGRH